MVGVCDAYDASSSNCACACACACACTWYLVPGYHRCVRWRYFCAGLRWNVFRRCIDRRLRRVLGRRHRKSQGREQGLQGRVFRESYLQPRSYVPSFPCFHGYFLHIWFVFTAACPAPSAIVRNAASVGGVYFIPALPRSAHGFMQVGMPCKVHLHTKMSMRREMPTSLSLFGHCRDG
jgi:hypothetical protein